jgi:hypothetical protein
MINCSYFSIMATALFFSSSSLAIDREEERQYRYGEALHLFQPKVSSQFKPKENWLLEKLRLNNNFECREIPLANIFKAIARTVGPLFLHFPSNEPTSNEPNFKLTSLHLPELVWIGDFLEEKDLVSYASVCKMTKEILTSKTPPVRKFRCFKGARVDWLKNNIDNLKRVSKLWLHFDCFLGSAGDIQLLGGLTNILFLGFSKVGNKGIVEDFIASGTLSQLEGFRFHMGGCGTIKSGTLAHLSKLSRLRHLDLADVRGIDLKYLSSAFNLQYLRVFCDTDEGLQALSSMHGLQELEVESDYRYSKISEKGLQHLTALPRLQSLRLVTCSDEGAQHLGAMRGLKSLTLWRPKITDRGLEHLSTLGLLQHLDLEGCKYIKDEGLRHLSAMGQLHRLGLEGCTRITDEGLRHLSTLGLLHRLGLEGCEGITDEGLRHLSTLDLLQHLSLEGCTRITDNGIEYLSTLSMLRDLNLAGCKQLSGKSLQHLLSMPQLANLDLVGCFLITGYYWKYAVERWGCASPRSVKMNKE